MLSMRASRILYVVFLMRATTIPRADLRWSGGGGGGLLLEVRTPLIGQPTNFIQKHRIWPLVLKLDMATRQFRNAIWG